MTAQERRIVRDLFAIYAVYGVVVGVILMSFDWGTVPQWLTVGVAVVAGGIAIYSVSSQREIVRKRAAVDVFIKIEMDQNMIAAYDSFHAGLNRLRELNNVELFCTAVEDRPHYLAIRKYLNIHELIAVGIKKEVLDEDVCYHYWCDTLTNGFRDAQAVIDYVRNRPKNKYTYSDLRALNENGCSGPKRKAKRLA
jgi:hypothetical protein